MKTLFQIAIVIALAYITAYYTSNKNPEKKILDFDFNISEFFEDDYAYEYSEDLDIVLDDGKYYFQNENYSVALEYFRQASTIDSLNSESIYYVAECYKGLKDYHKSEEYFRKTLSMDSVFFSEANVGLGTIAFSASKFDTALIYFNKAIEIKPDNENAYYQRAENYLSLSDTLAAFKDFKYAVELNSNLYLPVFRLASVLYTKKEYSEAARYFSKALITEGANNYLCYYYRGLCYFSVNRHKEAIQDYKLALELNNTDAYLYYNIANSYDYLADTLNSIENFELFTMTTKEYDSFYDYSMKRIKLLKNKELILDED